jgi:hypothetical protein
MVLFVCFDISRLMSNFVYAFQVIVLFSQLFCHVFYLFQRHYDCIACILSIEAPCEGTNSARLFTPWERNALAMSKVHQIPWAHGSLFMGMVAGL